MTTHAHAHRVGGEPGSWLLLAWEDSWGRRYELRTADDLPAGDLAAALAQVPQGSVFVSADIAAEPMLEPGRPEVVLAFARGPIP